MSSDGGADDRGNATSDGGSKGMYGGVVLDHFRRPRNNRPLDTPSASEEAFNPLCGDRVRLEVSVEGDVIVAVGFTANACAVCTAAASMLTERVTGAAVEDAAGLSDADVLRWLDTALPAGRTACATLPLRALHAALADLPS